MGELQLKRIISARRATPEALSRTPSPDYNAKSRSFNTT